MLEAETMGSMMWMIFVVLLAVLAVSLLWLIWRLRNFSQSHHHTVMDDKLLQSMLRNDALPKDVKSKLINRSGTTGEVHTEEEEQPVSDPAKPAEETKNI